MLFHPSAVRCPAKRSPFEAIAGRPVQACRCLRAGCGLTSVARAPFRLAGAASFKPTLLAVSVFACSMTVAGCAHDPARNVFLPAQHKVGSPPVQARANRDHPERRRYAQRRRLDAALLSQQPTPDCEFRGGRVEAMDATELARLKTEYELRCYRNAEKAARDRLGLLQGAVRQIRDQDAR
jgi:hypothetical protein